MIRSRYLLQKLRQWTSSYEGAASRAVITRLPYVAPLLRRLSPYRRFCHQEAKYRSRDYSIRDPRLLLSRAVEAEEKVGLFDFRDPHEWYLVSRSIKRRIIYHVGPTNSGKTHAAVESLKESRKGLYCAPLRLLAMEIHETLNRDGIFCNLRTGQERKTIPGARHSAVTIEMIDFRQRFDVAVVDEIQLIGHSERACSWTRALHGLAANELHLCGDPSALALVKKICKDMDEELIVHTYKRLTPLVIDSRTLASYENVQPGDCIVAFARQDIYDIKNEIEYFTGHRVAVIYGALPPEVRRQQAALFNTQGNGYEVMVASDAVGMGLNLNIRRIVFHSLVKFDGRSLTDLPVTQIKQISGRAGRRSSIFAKGKVTCLKQSDMDFARAALKLSSSNLKTRRAGLFPENEHITKIAQQLEGDSLTTVLRKIVKNGQIDKTTYFMCSQTGASRVAEALSMIPLSIGDLLMFCMAPVSTDNPAVLSALVEYATVYSRKQPVHCRLVLPDSTPRFHEQLKTLETAYEIASLWMWLSLQIGRDYFPSRRKTEKQLKTVNDLFVDALKKMTIPVRPIEDLSQDVLCTKREKNAKALISPIEMGSV